MWDKLFDTAMRHFVQQGALEVSVAGGAPRRYGDPAAEPVKVALKDRALMRELLVAPDIALGEAYMDERITVEDDDPRALLALALQNRTFAAEPWMMRLSTSLAQLFQRFIVTNPLDRSRKNAAHHYDLDGRLYDLFLDRDRQYSCGYWPRDGMTLDEAQEAKKAHIIGKLCLEPGMNVLDIGCGWGGMAITLARDYGARVTGVTLSEEQLKLGLERVKAAGLEDKVELKLQDYRRVDRQFDRVVSVGMFEHVGRRQFFDYFDKVHELLTEGGVALIHSIGSAEPPGATSPWVRKYIFPGGYLPSMSEISEEVEKARLYITDLEVWRLHYAKTLRAWHDRFMEHIDEAVKLHDRRFTRMWRYYLTAAEEGFIAGSLVNFQVQIARKKDAVPITRDYLYSGNVRAAD